MPVPSSYNDITQSKLIRDHIGWAWYDHSFRVPQGWGKEKRIFLRFGGVNYHAIVVSQINLLRMRFKLPEQKLILPETGILKPYVTSGKPNLTGIELKPD